MKEDIVYSTGGEVPTYKIEPDDVIMADGRLASLEYRDSVGMDRGRMLELLRAEPMVAVELLSCRGRIFYMGENRSDDLRVRLSGDGDSVLVGMNRYGRFLEECRDEYLREFRGCTVDEEPVRAGQVTVDYTPDGDGESYVERRESSGVEFIHTESHRPSRFQDVRGMRTGMTGYDERRSDADVYFKRFECPFGTGRRSRVQVGSAAEAALYYETALRGDLDYRSLFHRLQSSGLMERRSARDLSALENDLRAQFGWMREAILTDRSLRDRTIVAESALVPDASYGRSTYDPVLAPSPAHVLARYINNPMLFFSMSENGVMRALESVDKEEPLRFSKVTDRDMVTIVIDGSDTIGGRIPGTRGSVRVFDRYQRDENGRLVYDRYGNRILAGRKRTGAIMFKPEAEMNEDYAAFSSRMDSILANIPDGTRVRLVTGTGIGTPRMAVRYVQERRGAVSRWDYASGMAVVREEGGDALSVITMPEFSKVWPVLAGRERKVEVEDAEGEVAGVFSSDDLFVDGYVSFSVREDARNSDIIRRGSVAELSGRSVLHVMENTTEEEQRTLLGSESSSVRFRVMGGVTYSGSLFEGGVRKEWSLDGVSVFADRSESTSVDLFIPYVCNVYDEPVYVSGVAFSNVYGAYCALLLKGLPEPDIEGIRHLGSCGGDMVSLSGILKDRLGGTEVAPQEKERSMRNAVHMMAQSSSRFADTLLSTGNLDIVVPSSFGDPSLFVDSRGKGENRFGVVLMAERENMKRELAVMREKAEQEARKVAEENMRDIRRRNTVRAEGEKVADGLPSSVAESRDAVWFLGTAEPLGLNISAEGDSSFDLWVENDDDFLNRGTASMRKMVCDDGTYVDNRYVFLFPSDQYTASGRRYVKNYATSRDLTNLTRVDPATGREFVCAYGIPVKKNMYSNELRNPSGLPCSYMLDSDSGALVNGIVSADTLARTTAINRGMKLCYSAFIDRRGEENDSISRVFLPRIWDYRRTEEKVNPETGKVEQEGGQLLSVREQRRVYDSEKGKYVNVTMNVIRKQWVDNPHASERNLLSVRRYESILRRGADYPLNCICMPRADYSKVAEGVFLNDLSMALAIANSAAISLGVPLKFPLGSDGRLDLGPAVPENLRRIAENRINSFLGDVHDESVEAVPVTELHRLDAYGEYRATRGRKLSRDGSEFYVRPNSLVSAFGLFDFGSIANGNAAPMHEMTFMDGDGVVYKLVDPRITSKMQLGEINKYLSYSKNDECRFTVASTDPERIPAFLAYLRRRVSMADGLEVEYRLVQEGEMTVADESLDGYVNLFPSNSDELPQSDHDIACRDTVTALEVSNRFDGTDADSVYYGRIEAADGFSGYVQVRCRRPDGEWTAWKVVDDLSLAKDLVRGTALRTYRTDLWEVPSPQAMRCMLRSYASVAFGDEVMPESEILRLSRGETAPAAGTAKMPCSVVRSFGDAPAGAVLIWAGAEGGRSEQADIVFESLGDCTGDYLSDSAGRLSRGMDVLTEGYPGRHLCFVVPESVEDGGAALASWLRDNGLEVSFEPLSASAETEASRLVFTESDGGYQARTRENAQADDVDFTLALAVDFSTHGERCTARAAGDSLVSAELPRLADGHLDMSPGAVSSVADALCGQLPDEVLGGEACGFNIAGNGIYTLSPATQEEADVFVTALMLEMRERGIVFSSVRSGGQTGIDEAAVAAALACGVETVTVHAPKGFVFRKADGKDARGREAFTERFSRKNPEALMARAREIRAARAQQRKDSGRKKQK